MNVGFETAITPELSLSVAGIYKRSGGFTGNIDPLRPFDEAYDQVQVTNPVSSAPMTIYLEKPEYFSLLRQSILTNLPQNKRVYKGIEFTLRKRWDQRWQLVASYLYGQAEGTLGQHFNDSVNRNLTNPNALINDYGPLSLDSPHTIKINGSYLAPWDIQLAVSYLGISGVPTNSIAAELGNFYAGATSLPIPERRGLSGHQRRGRPLPRDLDHPTGRAARHQSRGLPEHPQSSRREGAETRRPAPTELGTRRPERAERQRGDAHPVLSVGVRELHVAGSDRVAAAREGGHSIRLLSLLRKAPTPRGRPRGDDRLAGPIDLAVRVHAGRDLRSSPCRCGGLRRGGM